MGLKISTSHLQEKSKYLRLVSKERRSWVRARWLAYLKEAKKRLEKGGKRE